MAILDVAALPQEHLHQGLGHNVERALSPQAAIADFGVTAQSLQHRLHDPFSIEAGQAILQLRLVMLLEHVRQSQGAYFQATT